MLIMIKGAGDLASGIACTLIRAGYAVILTEISHPTVVRRTVSFAMAVFDGSCRVEDIEGRLAHSATEALALAEQGIAAVLVDPELNALKELRPPVLVDAVIAKHNDGLSMDDAPLVIAVGPGFIAGTDCHAVIESQRGPTLGSVIWSGAAQPDSGVPGLVGGYAAERIIRAPADGEFIPLKDIGDMVELGEPMGRVGESVVRAQLSGMVRGMLAPHTPVHKGLKSGDIDPRRDRALCCAISDKALAIGAAVLQAVRQWKF